MHSFPLIGRWRLSRAVKVAVGLALIAPLVTPTVVVAQQVVGGDFDICDFCGDLSANTMRLRGRPGFGTNQGVFVLVNSANDPQDVDKDGFTPGVDFTHLFIQQVSDLQSAADPSRVIVAQNFVLGDFLNPLRNGFQNNVKVSVNIPIGTPAGIYRGTVTLADSLLVRGVNANGELLRVDGFNLEIEVLPVGSEALVQADTAAELDSLVIRARAGQRASGVFRIANTGNTPLTDVRISVSDLRSESALGISIPASLISASPPAFSQIAFGDTARVTISVAVPRGILGGRYRGTLFVQASNAPGLSVPVVLIVTSSRGLAFENNPVRNSPGVARIAFNADPGTEYKLAIFDMSGLLVYTTTGTVFAGVSLTGTPGTVDSPAAGADFAVSVTWPLVNGRGEGVASGMYLVVVESTVNQQRQLAQAKLIVIR